MSPGADDGRIGVEFVLNDLRVGGAERVFQTLIYGLDPSLFRVSVCTMFGDGPLGDEMHAAGVDVHCCASRGPLDTAGFRRFLSRVGRTGIDVLYVNSTPASDIWCVFASRLTHRPVIAALHYTQRLHRVARTKGVHRLLQGSIARFVALSETHKAYICEAEGVSPDRVEVISNGVDLRAYRRASPDKDAARARLGLPKSGTVVGILARLRPEKRHDVFLRIAERVSSASAETSFVIVGDGPEEAGLRRQAAELGLERRVTFAGHQTDVPSVIRAIDIGVLCSRFETFPLSLLEFMASGVAVVTTDVGSVRDIVLDGQTGLVVPEGDEEALASAVSRLVRDASLRAEFGSAGSARVEGLFTTEKMVAGNERLIRDVVGG